MQRCSLVQSIKAVQSVLFAKALFLWNPVASWSKVESAKFGGFKFDGDFFFSATE